MRRAASLLGLIAIAAAFGCDSASGQASTVRFLSREALMGLVVTQTGGDVEAELVLFDDSARMPDPRRLREGQDFGGLPLARGIVDREAGAILFPLRTTTVAQERSARLLRQKGAPYVELDLDFSRPEVVGRWREGSSAPKYARTFVRCGR